MLLRQDEPPHSMAHSYMLYLIIFVSDIDFSRNWQTPFFGPEFQPSIRDDGAPGFGLSDTTAKMGRAGGWPTPIASDHRSSKSTGPPVWRRGRRVRLKASRNRSSTSAPSRSSSNGTNGRTPSSLAMASASRG